MAEINEEAVISGILGGLEVAVGGGLLSSGEVLDDPRFLGSVTQQALTLVTEIMEPADQNQYPIWRQVIAGEITGMAVGANTVQGTSGELEAASLREILVAIFRKIDKYNDGEEI
jgi:hypothetical protein